MRSRPKQQLQQQQQLLRKSTFFSLLNCLIQVVPSRETIMPALHVQCNIQVFNSVQNKNEH